MGVIGCGVDLVEIARLQRALQRPGFLLRVFTPGEREFCQGARGLRVPSLAGRFAAKEAAFKALGQGWPRLAWQDVEIVRAAGEPPCLLLWGRARERARELGVGRALVSLAHNRCCAMAQVLLVK